MKTLYLFSRPLGCGDFLILALDEERSYLGDDIEEKSDPDDRNQGGQRACPRREVGVQRLAVFVIALLAGVRVGVALPPEPPLGILVYGALLGAEQVSIADGGQGDRGKVEALGELPFVVGEAPELSLIHI